MNVEHLDVSDQNLIPESNYYTVDEFNSTVNAIKPTTNNGQNFSLIHVNIRSLYRNLEKFDLFLSLINKSQFSVIAITETWLHSKSPPIFDIENYTLLRADRQKGRGGGVALYIRKDLKYKLRQDFHIEGVEDLFIETIDTKFKNKVIGVIYRPPSNSLETFLDNLDNCLEKITVENKDNYLVGDFNIDLSEPHNFPCHRFIDTLSSYAFHPHIDKPTRISNTSRSIIDNIFSNDLNSIRNGIIYYDISDHLPIFMISQKRTSFINQRNAKYKMCRKETDENINSFKLGLSSEEWHNVFTELDVNQAYDNFRNKLLYHYNKNIPLVRINSKNKKNRRPWITRGILNSIRKRNTLYKHSLNHPNEDNHKKYTCYRNKLTTIIRLSRKTYFSRKLEQNKNNTDLLWQTVNDMLGRQKDRLINSEFIYNGQNISEPEHIANIFNEYFTNIGPKLASEIRTDNGHFSQYLSNYNDNSLFFNPTNVHEILDVVKSLKSSKSSGNDEISVNLLKKIIFHIASPLAHIINLSLSVGMFPKSLKIAKVIPIYKKDDPSQITNYRPISLLPSISKVLEKIVYKRLYSFLNQNNLLIPNQYGFRKNNSTDYAILQLCDKITDSLSKKEHVIGVFMDLSKAFDTIDHNILIHKLRTYGVRGNALSWFEDYLHDRSQYVTYKSSNSRSFAVKCGVPQGSVLGPLLFLIYINDITFSAPLLTYILFADDTNVLFSHRDLDTLITTLNSELVKLSRWFKSNKLSLNINKTNFIYFKNVHSQHVPCNITIDGLPLVEKESTKFLGVTIDSNLTWSIHINNICTSTSRNMGILHKLKHLLPVNSLRILYNSLILPFMSYCNIAWGNTCKTRIKTLLLIQKKAIRICTLSHYLSNTDPLFHQLKTLKIDDIHTFQTAIFMFKFSRNTLPTTFQTSFTYNSNVHDYATRRSSDIHLTNPKILLAHKTIRHHGPDVWNSLPENIKLCSSLYSFKAVMKSHLLSRYNH